MINVDLSKLKEIISSDLRLAGNIIQAIINFLSRNSFSSDFSSDINNILEKYKEVQRISSEASKSISDAISIIGGIEKGNINSIRDIVRDTNSNRPTKTNTRSSNKADNIEYLGDTTSEPEEKSSVDAKKENTTNDVKVENVSKTTKEVDKTTNIETVKSTDTSSSNQVSKIEETTKAVETNDLVTVADNILKVDSVDNSKTGANETKGLSDENSSFMERIINWLKKAWSELRYKFKSKTKETQQIRSEFTKEINNVSDRNSQVYENSVNNAFFQNMPKFESTLKDLGIEDWQLIDDDTRSKYEKYEKDLLDLLNEFNNLGGNFALASDNIDEETRAKLNKLQNEIQTLSEERNKFINDTIEDVMRDVNDAGLSLAERIKKLDEEREELDGSLNEYSISAETIKHYGEECERINAEKNDLQKKLDAYTAFKAEYMGQLKQINFSSKSATYSLSALEGFNYTEAEISEYMENVYKNSGSELSYETWKAFNQEACVEQFLIEKGNEWRIEKYGSLDYLSSNPNIFVQVDEMEAGEIAMYNYLHEMVSVKAADDYLSFLEDELNRRKGEAKALEFLNSLKNNNVDYVRTAGEGVKNGLQNFLKGYHNLVFADSVVDVDDYENMYIIEALSGDGYKYGLDFTYSTASSIGNMLIPATLSTVVTSLTKNNKIGGVVGNVAMSLSIFGNTMDQSLEEGKTVESSFKYSAFSTATESVTSLFLSGVGFSIFEQKFGLLGNVVSEVTEEELQLLLDKGYKAIAEGDTEAFNNLKEEMGDTLTQTIVSTIILNGYNKATSTVAGAAMGGIASIKGKRANSVQPNSKIIDKAGASADVSEAFRIDYDAKNNKYDFVSPDGKKVLDSVNDVQTGDVYVSPNVQKAMNDVKGIESDVNSKVASENKNNSKLSDIEMLDAIDKSSKARKSEFYKEDISSNSASQKALDDVKQIQKEVSSGSKNKTTDVTANNTQTEAQRLREVEALRLKDGETFDVNKYDLNELETIRKNNPGVDLKIDADNNRIVASKNERYTYDVEFAEAKNSVKAKGAEAVQQIIDEVGEIDANKSFEDIAKEAQNKKTTKNKRRIDEYWVLFDDKDTSSSNKPGGKTGTNSDVSEAFKIDYDAKSNKYDFVSPDGKKIFDSIDLNNTQTEAQRLREVEALRLKDGETFDVNKYDLNELETIRKNNPGVDLKIDADNNRIVASKNERYTYDVEFAEAKNSVKAKGAEAVQQIIDEVGEIDANKSFEDIAKEAQKNSKASNSRDVYSDSHAQQIMDEIANVREDIKNKGTEDAKKIFDDIANIDANKSFSDIAKEAQKNGKTSNSRDVYSDSHVQQALEDLANIRKEVNAKFKKSSDSSSIKKTSSTMVNNFDNQMGIFENVGEVTSAGVLGASLLQGMNSDSTNISLRERFWAVNEFQNAFKTGANSNGELIELLSLGFDEAMYSGNKDALGIMKMLTGIKTLNPNLTIEVDANNGNYWSLDDSTLVIGSNTLESKNLDTVYHELGHCLFDSLMDGEVPENFSHAIDSAKYIYHDSPFSEFFTKTLKGLEYSTRVEANIAYENNLKQSLGISIDERVKTLSENYTSFFDHMNVDEINSVLNEYGMDFEDFLYNYSGSLIDLAHDLAIVEIRNQELAIQDKIFRAKYGAYTSLSDMVDAVHSGSDYGINGEHIYKFYQHGETYYKQESDFQFHELIADFTSLKLTGSTEALNYVKGMFGDELYNILDSTYKKFIYNV